MNETYPMFSFHRNLQKIAVANVKGVIVIYDIITASKFYSFEAHKSPIDGLSFSHDGTMIVSYSPGDFCYKIWSVETSVISILVNNSKLLKTIKFNEEKIITIDTNEILKSIKIIWVSDRIISITPGPKENKYNISI
jgi:WD40 repeat protein